MASDDLLSVAICFELCESSFYFDSGGFGVFLKMKHNILYIWISYLFNLNINRN